MRLARRWLVILPKNSLDFKGHSSHPVYCFHKASEREKGVEIGYQGRQKKNNVSTWNKRIVKHVDRGEVRGSQKLALRVNVWLAVKMVEEEEERKCGYFGDGFF